MSVLTEHFSWAEVSRSATADAKKIINVVPPECTHNVVRVAEAMELVRALLGDNPLKINSWYRCLELNRAIGGSPKSMHMKGLAVDFEPLTMTNDKAFERIAKSDIPFDQLIHERTKSGADWIHFGLAEGEPRGQVLVATGDTLGGPMAFRRIALG